ncbi:hypothetical protein [Ralstonia pseudosolanacearum]|uniref:hypothetical protein n=1 Tax=Ralstonia pseudosolanacearum TaxID=1310165 RepID=UPI001FFA0898|nr:hypothetical protein [Ralstonia pseudosolanacearum]
MLLHRKFDRPLIVSRHVSRPSSRRGRATAGRRGFAPTRDLDIAPAERIHESGVERTRLIKKRHSIFKTDNGDSRINFYTKKIQATNPKGGRCDLINKTQPLLTKKIIGSRCRRENPNGGGVPGNHQIFSIFSTAFHIERRSMLA